MTSGSVVVRKSLGRQLRALRLAAGKTPSDVETSGIASTSKLHRAETGAVPIRLETVWALCQLYGADMPTRDRLSEMAKNTNEKGWWEDYADLMTPRFGTYVELEAASDKVLTYDGELIYGLLQTPDYHRAVFEFDADGSPQAVERHIRLRSERQRSAFDRDPPLDISTVVGEGAIERLVGGKKVMLQQRLHLLDLSRQPHIEVRVLLNSSGAHAAMKGAFNILQFDSPEDPDVVYLETYAGGRYVEEETRLIGYRNMFQNIHTQSISIEEYLR